MPEQRHDLSQSDRAEPAWSVSHLIHTLQKYFPVILLGMVAVMVGYVIVAAAAYLLAPSQKVTSQNFRLDFKGADHGEYPNGTKFAPSEILSGPVVLKVYQNNKLDRFVRFTDFARSLVVLESNRAMDALARDYQSRLADPRITPIDRERIQREYEARLASISKGQYALAYMRPGSGKEVPEIVVRKVLNDVLTEWATFVANEQHVLEYRIAVLSPDLISDTTSDGTNRVINISILRAKVLRVMENIDQIRKLPSADLARTEREALSLNDISQRLTEIVRFRLEPLISRTAASGLDQRAETLRFFETQLAYDERQLDASQREAEAAQKTLAMFVSGKGSPENVTTTPARPAQQGTSGTGTAETVMPQLSDTFIDRIIQLTSSTGDTEYRQRLANNYQETALRAVPLHEAVAYNRSFLDFIRSAPRGDNLTLAAVDQQLASARADVRQLVVKTHDIYSVLSGNLNPSTELITRTGVPSTRMERSLTVKQLGTYGILVTALSLPLLIFLCLVHNRVREEDEAEEAVRPQDAAETTA
jgi:hypothetical protein